MTNPWATFERAYTNGVSSMVVSSEVVAGPFFQLWAATIQVGYDVLVCNTTRRANDVQKRTVRVWLPLPDDGPGQSVTTATEEKTDDDDRDG